MSDLKPCPFCDGQPVFNGDGKNWQDENRFVLMELECCVSMRASIGWAKARDMTPAAIETALKSKLTEAWNRRAQPAQAGQALSDEDVLRAAARTLDSEVVEVSPLSCIKDFARAIEAAVLAKRVPMTDAQIDESMRAKFYPARNRAFIDGVEAAELHHGIVGEKGGA